MRKLDEQREILYVIRTLDVLMSSGVGLEAAIHTIGSGGYGVISEDFSSMMKRLRKGTGGGLDRELKGLLKKAEWVDVYIRENPSRLVGTRCFGRIPKLRSPEMS